MQVNPHPDHAACFVGTRRTSEVAVCAVPVSPGAHLEVQIVQAASGGRIGRPWKSYPPAQVGKALRAAFRDHT